jgi:hypothetical protein
MGNLDQYMKLKVANSIDAAKNNGNAGAGLGLGAGNGYILQQAMQT